MTIDIIKSRLRDFRTETIQDEQFALRQIAQEIALSSLSRGEFFHVGAFQGGTCLRILYGLERFSEDLDFVLLRPDDTFSWEPYLKQMMQEFSAYGWQLTFKDRSKADDAVKRAFIKEDSIGLQLQLSEFLQFQSHKPLSIKLEIDTHPPEYSSFETKFLDFPLNFSVTVQDLPSLFASKCHALLCRPYTKGRDWFDFLWYVAHKPSINVPLLQSALYQHGPWKRQQITVDTDWIIQRLQEKIQSIDWQEAAQDVKWFLPARQVETLKLWSLPFFQDRAEKLSKTLVR